MSNSDIQIVQIPIARVIPHPENYKKHPQNQLNALKASLLRFGQVKPIVAQKVAGRDDYIILAGHGLTLAALQLIEEQPRNERIQQWVETWTVAIVPPSWSVADAKAYLVADNEIASKALTDETALAALLEEQRALGADLLSVGSSTEELDAMLARLGDEFLAANESEEDGEGYEPDGFGAPEEFNSFDEGIHTDYHCPKCGYEWSGKAK